MEAAPRASSDLYSPEVVRFVADPARPDAVVPFSHDLAGFPGETGVLAGMRMFTGLIRAGEDYTTALVDKHGPIFRHMLGSYPVVVVADADVIASVLRNDEAVWSTALAWYTFVGGLDASGPALYDFAPHRDVRRLLQPSFAAPAVAGYLSAALDIFGRTIDEWGQQRRVRFKTEVRRMLAAVSARVFMGISDRRIADRIDRAFEEMREGPLAIRKRAVLSLGWQRAKRGVAIVRGVMRERGGGGADLLSRLSETRDEADWLDDRETRERLFVGIMSGAFDTTSSGFTSMAYLLAKHQDWQEALREEARSVATDRPTPADLQKLERLGWAWKESLRLYPVVGHIFRQALRETKLGAYRMPAGGLALLLGGSVGRDRRWWTDPLRFDPERFSPERAEDRRHKSIFLPFGAGAHACVGAQLATVEAKAFWHAFLRRYRFRLRRDYEAHHGYRPVGILSGNVDLVLEPTA